jgi:hypothetical protein
VSMIRYSSYQSGKSNLRAYTNILYIFIHESVTYIATIYPIGVALRL